MGACSALESLSVENKGAGAGWGKDSSSQGSTRGTSYFKSKASVPPVQDKVSALRGGSKVRGAAGGRKRRGRRKTDPQGPDSERVREKWGRPRKSILTAKQWPRCPGREGGTGPGARPRCSPCPSLRPSTSAAPAHWPPCSRPPRRPFSCVFTLQLQLFFTCEWSLPE